MEEYLDEHKDDFSADTVIHDLDYWRQVLDPAIERCRIEKLIRGYSPSRVYRIHLEYGRNGVGPASVVCKESRVPWPDTDPDGLNREWFVYRECLLRLPVVGPGLLHSERSATGNRLVLVDLDLEHYFLPAQHVWAAAQFRPVLETLALLHVAAEDLPLQDYSLLMPEPDQRWDSHVVQTAIRTLVTDKTYGEGARRLCPVVDELLEDLAAQFGYWQRQPRTLLHCDFNPSNVAFQQGGGTARLIDWHIAGTGMAAFEIASLFYQPYHNHKELDRSAIVRDYVEVRRELDGRSVHHDEEWAAFCYAMAGNGLSYLPPVARTLQQTGRLGDWWGNMFEAIVENLEWCASQR